MQLSTSDTNEMITIRLGKVKEKLISDMHTVTYSEVLGQISA